MFLSDSFYSTDHTLVNFGGGFCVMKWCSLHLVYGDRLTLCKIMEFCDFSGKLYPLVP